MTDGNVQEARSLQAFVDVLSEKRFVGRFNASKSDEGMKFAAERAFALEAIKRSPLLAECSPASVHNALLDVAFIGLTLSPVLSYCYLIPYRDKRRDTVTATVKISYRGLLNLCYRAGVIRSLQADVVRENDPVFKVRRTALGTDFEHIQARKDRGEITHAYATALFASGGHHVEIMDARQIEAVERFAKSKGGGQAWGGPFREEMAKKAVIRRAWKSWPSDPALAHAADVMDRYEPVDLVTIEDGEAVQVISRKQVSTLVDMAAAYDVPLAKVCAALNVERIEALPEKRFEEAKFLIERRR
jgi:phage RecT family recombinase